ncbi:MAG: adenylate kinase [Deltaproteobacteria bacterium CG_4_9_14_3_um_filter_63_12]|nr:MAG: adenylate kinase [Deltaproteobacteria bacterium CG17_big_fil_post_rev_8_21_14_2_50_63_7]PJB35131.1 MAG: adenylate kinase [Deltaproteobacteria bacterium CG_4_9_14_3_um_filter_63_12]
MGIRLIMLGPPGAGKGTQAVKLAEVLGIPKISTGDMLREAKSAGSALGREAARFMSEGQLVPDEVVIGIVDERLKKLRDGGYILDGFPRTVAQAVALGQRGCNLTAVVSIEVPNDFLIERITGRLACICGQTYHRINKPPKVEGVCDACGSALTVRADDVESVVRERLEVYAKHTAPLVAYYEAQGVLLRVNGVGEMGEVLDRILKELESARKD